MTNGYMWIWNLIEILEEPVSVLLIFGNQTFGTGVGVVS